jgi:hypothetical protein
MNATAKKQRLNIKHIGLIAGAALCQIGFRETFRPDPVIPVSEPSDRGSLHQSSQETASIFSVRSCSRSLSSSDSSCISGFNIPAVNHDAFGQGVVFTATEEV